MLVGTTSVEFVLYCQGILTAAPSEWLTEFIKYQEEYYICCDLATHVQISETTLNVFY